MAPFVTPTFVRLALMVTTLFFSAVLRAADAYPPVDVRMDLRQVGEGVWYVMGAPGMASDNAGFISNAGFVLTSKGVVVIDGLGTPSLAKKLRGLIATQTDKPVIAVLVTHYHADHIYGLQVFKDEGAEIIAPAGSFDYLASANAVSRLDERRFSLDPWVNASTRLIRPDRIIDKDTRLQFGDLSVQLHYLGAAHSSGDMSVYLEGERILFSGDIIFEGRLPFVGDANSKRWLQALEDMNRQRLRALVPGHGPAARKPAQALANTRDYLALLRRSMGNAVAEMNEFAAAYAAVDWSAYRKLPAFEAANRRNAYQVYLSMEQEAMGQE
jgi:glyoxylase-like metal-dependent hydrolase (beta-lactamase superfamily II)